MDSHSTSQHNRLVATTGELKETVQRFQAAGGQLENKVIHLSTTIDAMKGDMDAFLTKITNVEA